MVVGNRWHDMFYRSCEWQIKDESMDQVGSEGYCAVTGEEKSMHVCTCSTDKCNTGFNGNPNLSKIMSRFLKVDNLQGPNVTFTRLVTVENMEDM